MNSATTTVRAGGAAIGDAAALAARTGERASAPGSALGDASAAVVYENVGFAYAGADGSRKAVLENVSLEVAEGSRLGVLGPNGGGKSTLIKLTLGLLEGNSGQIRVFGLSPREAARRGLIGYVPQKSAAESSFPLTVAQVVAMSATLGNAPWRGPTREQREAISRAMEVVGATALADAHVGSLSGGQFQRVMIARALAGTPRLLLMDEPTVGIDVSGQQQFAQLLTRLHDELRLTVIVVSHDIRTVAAGCDRIACLSRTLHSHVSPEGLTPKLLGEVFRHDVAAIFGDVHVDAHAAATCGHAAHEHACGRDEASRQAGTQAGRGE
jgi:zinc transport system ATP-binding protein